MTYYLEFLFNPLNRCFLHYCMDRWLGIYRSGHRFRFLATKNGILNARRM